MAPTGGTARDVQSLLRELDLTAKVVLAVMNYGGRGYNRRTSTDAAAASESGVGGGRGYGYGAVAGSSAWSNFMSEEVPVASALDSAS